MMHLEYVFALFDTSLNGLATIVGMEPIIQVRDGIGLAVMKQRGPLHGVTGVVMEQGDIYWIGEIAIYSRMAPGSHGGIVAHLGPLCFGRHRRAQRISYGGEATAGVDIVTHFNQPIDVFPAGKATIETKRGPNGVGVGGIVRYKLLVMELQTVYFRFSGIITGSMPRQTTLGNAECLFTARQSLTISRCLALRSRQLAMSRLGPVLPLVVGCQSMHFLFPLLQKQLCITQFALCFLMLLVALFHLLSHRFPCGLGRRQPFG